jgi:hypothetical protein
MADVDETEKGRRMVVGERPWTWRRTRRSKEMVDGMDGRREKMASLR